MGKLEVFKDYATLDPSNLEMTMIPLNKIIAHRGASAYAPENTIASFDKALTLNSQLIEFDVMCTVDGEPFVFHDDNLRRTTNGRGDLSLVDAEYIKNLDAGTWFSKQFKGEKIPHFKEALKWLDFSGINANIEIKPYPGTTEKTTIVVLSHIHRYWPTGKELPLVSSFDWDALSLCRNIAPEMPLGLLIHDWDPICFERAKQLGCYSMHFNRKILNAEKVQAAKEQGYMVCSYTVNRKRQAKKLFQWGVDAVFSDFPDLLL